MDLVALAHEGVCKPQLKELDLILGGGKPLKGQTGGRRDTLARSLKRQMLGNVCEVNVTRETKAEWL